MKKQEKHTHFQSRGKKKVRSKVRKIKTLVARKKKKRRKMKWRLGKGGVNYSVFQSKRRQAAQSEKTKPRCSVPQAKTEKKKKAKRKETLFSLKKKQE